jgi:hypothetical protein
MCQTSLVHSVQGDETAIVLLHFDTVWLALQKVNSKEHVSPADVTEGQY